MKNLRKIKYLGAAALLALALTSCEDSIDKINTPIPLSSIGGFTNSDDIETANLIAKMSFEGNGNDAVGGISNAVGTNVNYTTGVKGQAFKGSSSMPSYFVTNLSSAITGLNDFTIAFWLNSAGTVANPGKTPVQGEGAQSIFEVVAPQNFWGGIDVFLQNPDANNPNRIRVVLQLQNGRPGVAWAGQAVTAEVDGQKNQWFHITMSYSSKDSKAYVYVNGDPAKLLDGFAYAPSGGVSTGFASWFSTDPGGLDNPNNVPGYGQFAMAGTNGKGTIGAFQFETNPPLNNGGPQTWATTFAGKLDEFRIYNTVLKAGEVSALYNLEKNGR